VITGLNEEAAMTELVTADEPAVAERFDGFRHAVSDTFVPLRTTTDERCARGDN
jgi:hypothetical protein